MVYMGTAKSSLFYRSILVGRQYSRSRGVGLLRPRREIGVTFYVNSTEHEALSQAADRLKMSLSNFIRHAIFSMVSETGGEHEPAEV